MSERHFCGRCNREFEPKPYFYAGGSLCDNCRAKISDRIDQAKSAYDKLDRTTRSEVDFASAVSGSLPKARTEFRCGCGAVVGEAGLCSSCQNAQDRQDREHEREQARARREFDRRIRGL